MQDPLVQILDFLVSTLLGIYIILLLLRVILGIFRADFYNPISQTIVKLTNPPLYILRRVLPPLGRVDTAAIVLVILIKFLEIWLRLALIGVGIDPGAVLLLSIREILISAVWILIISLIIEVVLSWLQPMGGPASRNPVTHLVLDINRPLLSPMRRILPNTGMIDFSPMAVLILLYVILILLRSF